MNYVLSFIVLFLYLFLISYFSQMLIFDYYKYIKKDKYLKDIKFRYTWKADYYKRKYSIEAVEEYKNSLVNDEVEKDA